MTGTPERLGGKPRENVEDAYATFMDMPAEQWSDFVLAMVRQSGGLTPAEREGLHLALNDERRKAGRVLLSNDGPLIDDEPTDDEIYNRGPYEPDARHEHDPSL